MNDASLPAPAQLQEFLVGTAEVIFTSPADAAARHRFITGAL